MIVVDFPEAANCRVCLKVTGHSGFEDKGKDIVCAAVSTLVQTFVGGVETELEALVKGNLTQSNCNLEILVTPERQPELATICKVFKFGFLKICESYPEHVKLN